MKTTLKKQDFYRALETALDIEPEFITDERAASMDFQLDSMGVMILLAYVDSELGSPPDPAALLQCRSIRQLVETIGETSFAD